MTTLQSIGPMIPQPGGGKPGGAGILQTQLSRFETQLADWCSCPSGKTPEGKKIITDLQQKAHSVKLQIKQIEDSRAKGASSVAPAMGASLKAQDGAKSDFMSGLRIDLYA